MNHNDVRQSSRRARAVRPLAIFAAASMALTLMACTAPDGGDGGEGDSEELTSLVFALPNQRSIQYHPFYIADELGYFEENGLDVTIEIVSGSSATVQQVIAGNIDVAMTVASAASQGVAQGNDLTWIYSYFYRNIFDFVVPDDSDVQDISDLKGGIIGVSDLSGGEVPEIRAIMSEAGLIDGVDYTIQPVGEGGALTLTALQDGTVDAYSSSVFDVASIEGAGLPLRSVMPELFVFSPSLGIVATTDTFENRHDDLIGFVNAVQRADAWAQENEAEANEIAEKYGPELYEDPAIAEAFWATTMNSKTPPDSLGDRPMGSNDLDGWEHLMDALAQATEEEGGIPEGTVDLDSFLDDTVTDDAAALPAPSARSNTWREARLA